MSDPTERQIVDVLKSRKKDCIDQGNTVMASKVLANPHVDEYLISHGSKILFFMLKVVFCNTSSWALAAFAESAMADAIPPFNEFAKRIFKVNPEAFLPAYLAFAHKNVTDKNSSKSVRSQSR